MFGVSYHVIWHSFVICEVSMRYPEFIKKNDTVAFIAPAFGCTIEPYKSSFENFLEILKNDGFNTEIGKNVYKEDGVGISSDPASCAKELEEYYISDSNDAIISCGGGELMCETISNVDFEKIKEAKPKWYMGYSDNTHMTFLLTTLCDVASIYGPNAPKFGMESWHESIFDAWHMLNGKCLSVHNYDRWEIMSLKSEEDPLAGYNCTEPTILKGYKPDKDKNMVSSDDIKMSGRLIGGCMDCLVGIRGTRFDRVGDFLERYKDDGFIWFLESCDLNVFSMRRAMWQMYESGWFKYCRGFIIGRPLQFNEPMFNLDQYDAILYTVSKLDVPVIMDADIGHLSPMMPLICGSMADVALTGNSLSIQMRLE